EDVAAPLKEHDLEREAGCAITVTQPELIRHMPPLEDYFSVRRVAHDRPEHVLVRPVLGSQAIPERRYYSGTRCGRDGLIRAIGEASGREGSGKIQGPMRADVEGCIVHTAKRDRERERDRGERKSQPTS